MRQDCVLFGRERADLTRVFTFRGGLFFLPISPTRLCISPSIVLGTMSGSSGPIPGHSRGLLDKRELGANANALLGIKKETDAYPNLPLDKHSITPEFGDVAPDIQNSIMNSGKFLNDGTDPGMGNFLGLPQVSRSPQFFYLLCISRGVSQG